MIEFLISWAEQLIIALIIIVLVEMILPNSSNYKKYVKVILGIFLLYVIISPSLSDKIKNLEIKEVISDKYSSTQNISENVIKYDTQIENTYKIKFEEDIKQFLIEKGYNLQKINQDLKYENEEININKIELWIQKENKNTDKEKINIEIKNDFVITEDEIKRLKQELSKNYEIDENKIVIKKECASSVLNI